MSREGASECRERPFDVEVLSGGLCMSWKGLPCVEQRASVCRAGGFCVLRKGLMGVDHSAPRCCLVASVSCIVSCRGRLSVVQGASWCRAGGL